MLRGGASDLYGGQALSGVVQFLGKTPETTDADLDISYGSQSTPNASGYIGHAFGKWLASGAGEYFRTNGYIPVPESLRGAVDNPAESLHRNGELDLQRQLSQRSRLFVRGLAYDDSRHNGTLVEVNRTRAWNAAVGLDLETAANDLLQFRGYGGTEDYHQTFASVAADRNSESLARAQSVPSRDWGASAQYSRPLPARQNLLAGVDFASVTGESDDEIFTNGRPTSFANGGARNQTLGVFAEDIARITSRWIITPVVRFDRWQSVEGFSRNIALPSLITTTTPSADRSEDAVNPKLATRYQFNGAIAVRASVYRSFRSPTLNELYRSFRLGNTLTLDNPQLRAERLTGWEAGPMETLFAGKLRVQETIFWADVHRAIANVTLTTTPTLITRMRQNLGSTRARGLEAQVEWSAAKFTSISAQYQFVDALVTAFPPNTSLVGLRVPEVPRHEFTFQASYSNPALLTIAFQGRSSSSVFDDDINTLVLGSYFKLDAFISRRVNSMLDFYVAGENLLNQSYPVARSPIVTLGPPLLGRVGLQFHFGR
jgi:outer membrane receptor protein involved in Fe transport